MKEVFLLSYRDGMKPAEIAALLADQSANGDQPADLCREAATTRPGKGFHIVCHLTASNAGISSDPDIPSKNKKM